MQAAQHVIAGALVAVRRAYSEQARALNRHAQFQKQCNGFFNCLYLLSV